MEGKKMNKKVKEFLKRIEETPNLFICPKCGHETKYPVVEFESLNSLKWLARIKCPSCSELIVSRVVVLGDQEFTVEAR